MGFNMRTLLTMLTMTAALSTTSPDVQADAQVKKSTGFQLFGKNFKTAPQKNAPASQQDNNQTH